MKTEFKDSVAIVTGGAGGLGEATVRELVDSGCAVVIADMNDDKGEALAAELGDRVRYVRTDVLDDDAVGEAIAFSVDQFAAVSDCRRKVIDISGDCLLYTSPSPRD